VHTEGGQMKKIIFADDDPTIQDVINLLLEDEYQLTVFSSGEAILKNKFEVPDLFLLDKQLSDVDGLELCRFLKNQDSTRHVPIIIISASHTITHDARSAGADAVIEKPFSINLLKEIIARHTKSPRKIN
jgi:CheY-like chemotaxis protein